MVSSTCEGLCRFGMLLRCILTVMMSSTCEGLCRFGMCMNLLSFLICCRIRDGSAAKHETRKHIRTREVNLSSILTENNILQINFYIAINI